MESVWISVSFSAMIAVLGLLWRDLNRKLNGKVNAELCQERSAGIVHQLEHQEKILLRTEQRLIGMEKQLAYLYGEVGNELDRH